MFKDKLTLMSVGHFRLQDHPYSITPRGWLNFDKVNKFVFIKLKLKSIVPRKVVGHISTCEIVKKQI